MKYITLVFGLFALGGLAVFSQPQKGQNQKGQKKVEVAHPFYWAAADPLRGDWQSTGGYVAQVIRADDKVLSVADLIPQAEDAGKYQANLFRKFDLPNDKPVAVLQGALSGATVTFSGDGWTGTIAGGHFKAAQGDQTFDLQHITRTPPSLGEKPPAGAIVLFDGTNMDAWAKKQDRNWLKEDGPSPWHLVAEGLMEVVPRTDCIISHKWFGDCKIHVEFRNVGGPTNSGVYIQDRYEANINEMYGRIDGNPCAGFDNCTPASVKPGIRCSRPPLEWQTMDIDFHAPRFDASGNKTANPRATLLFNGTLLYDNRELGPVTLNAARLGRLQPGRSSCKSTECRCSSGISG